MLKVWCSTNQAISPDDLIWAKTGSSRTFTFDCVSRDDQKNHSFSIGIYTLFRLFKTTFLTRVVCMFAQLANIRTADLAFTLSLVCEPNALQLAGQMRAWILSLIWRTSFLWFQLLNMGCKWLSLAHCDLRTSKMRGFFRISAWWSTCVNKALGLWMDFGHSQHD